MHQAPPHPRGCSCSRRGLPAHGRAGAIGSAPSCTRRAAHAPVSPQPATEMMASRAMAMLLLAAPLAHAGTNEAGKKFLAEKAKEDGVIVLESGLMYKVLRKGDGAYHPTADSSCSCHYGGKLINGETFDSSYDRGSPTDFAPNQVIKGWTEAMQLMVEGDKWEMYIPSELGYGDGGSPPKIQARFTSLASRCCIGCGPVLTTSPPLPGREGTCSCS